VSGLISLLCVAVAAVWKYRQQRDARHQERLAVATQGPHVLAVERALLYPDARLSTLLQASLRLRPWKDIGDGTVHLQGK